MSGDWYSRKDRLSFSKVYSDCKNPSLDKASLTQVISELLFLARRDHPGDQDTFDACFWDEKTSISYMTAD